MWRAGPIKCHWSSEDSTKYIKQSGVTHINQDCCHLALTLWFKRETTLSQNRLIWQGDTPEISAHLIRTDKSAE